MGDGGRSRTAGIEERSLAAVLDAVLQSAQGLGVIFRDGILDDW